MNIYLQGTVKISCEVEKKTCLITTNKKMSTFQSTMLKTDSLSIFSIEKNYKIIVR